MDATLLPMPGGRLSQGGTPAVIDFFCGCGGTSTGLSLAGMDVIAAVDNDPAASRTFQANFTQVEFHECDVRALGATAFDHLVDPSRPLVLAACAPCQPYSTMRRPGSRTRHREKSLLLCLLPFVKRHRPDVVMVENVPGLQRVPGGSTWNRFIAALRREGYTVRWQVIDCRDYGVPQRRPRLVMLASRHGRLEIPAASHGTEAVPHSTVREWISALPALDAGQVDPQDPVHRAGGIGPTNLRRLQALGEGGSRSEWPPDLWLECHSRARGHQDTYGRMRLDGTAPVLTTKCTDITNGRFGHPTQHRGLSVREAALLQTFPSDYRFIGGLKSMTRQVGNAVPVLMAKAMGEAVMAHLETGSDAGRG